MGGIHCRERLLSKLWTGVIERATRTSSFLASEKWRESVIEVFGRRDVSAKLLKPKTEGAQMVLVYGMRNEAPAQVLTGGSDEVNRSVAGATQSVLWLQAKCAMAEAALLGDSLALGRTAVDRYNRRISRIVDVEFSAGIPAVDEA